VRRVGVFGVSEHRVFGVSEHLWALRPNGTYGTRVTAHRSCESHESHDRGAARSPTRRYAHARLFAPEVVTVV
jgi:hypothetical protein